MKHSAWNPTRRNRKIGTEDSGYSKDNKLVIPDRWSEDKIFWERLSNPVKIPLKVKNHKITMFVEPTKHGYIHASTPNDILKILELIPKEHLQEIEIVVLRQPKEKEEILKPVWGRFVYYADLGKYTGAGVYLEAMKVGTEFTWGEKLTPFDAKELKALEKDGHKVEKIKRGYLVRTTPETVRNTQLFRTLPHEIGHAVDYLVNSIIPSIEATNEIESERITNAFFSKPSLDKEEFANRYSREFYSKNLKKQILPFPRIIDEEFLNNLDLDLKWFGLNKS